MLTWQVAYAPRPTRPNRPLRSGRRRPPWWRRCRSATHRPALRAIAALKSGFRSENAAGAAADPSGDASSFLCSPTCREATRGVLGPPCTTKAPPGARRPVRWHPLRTAAGAPTTAVAPPLMEGRSAPLLPRRRWEGHWWWPGRPSAAARRARAAGNSSGQAGSTEGRPMFAQCQT